MIANSSRSLHKRDLPSWLSQPTRLPQKRSWAEAKMATAMTPAARAFPAAINLVEIGLAERAGQSMDIVDQQTRSRIMGRIRGKNTKPELVVRRIAHRLGYRFRLHRNDLSGSPDLVFPSRRKVVFVHGCYWHRHPGCRFAYSPKSNVDFWNGKFEANKSRDAAALAKLREDGWDPLVIWECETIDPEQVAIRLSAHLGALR